MDTTLLGLVIVLIPIAYLNAKNLLIVRLRKAIGWSTGAVAAGGLLALITPTTSKWPYGCIVPFSQFLILIVVEETFRSMYGRYPAPVFAKVGYKKGEGADANAMLIGLLGCLAIGGLVMYLAFPNGPQGQ